MGNTDIPLIPPSTQNNPLPVVLSMNWVLEQDVNPQVQLTDNEIAIIPPVPDYQMTVLGGIDISEENPQDGEPAEYEDL